MTHTPGPWTTTASGIAFSGSAGFDFEPWGNTAPISQADARLIAAAPDLLAALRAIVAQAPTDEPDAEDYDDTESACTQGIAVGAWEAAEIARTAIAKAEGRQP